MLCTVWLLLQGGCVLRLFHKELEAYLVAEGLFDDEITEDGIITYPFYCKRFVYFHQMTASFRWL